MMTVERLQDKLAQAREKLLIALEPLPDEALEEAKAVGEWSVAQLLAHLASWEAELVTGLAEVQRGKRPARLLVALADREAYNVQCLADNVGRDLDSIFDDWQGARIQLEVRLEDLTERDLNEPRQYVWRQGKSLVSLIAELTYEHELAHEPAVRAFVRRWLAAHPEAVSDDVIQLGDIEVTHGEADE